MPQSMAQIHSGKGSSDGWDHENLWTECEISCLLNFVGFVYFLGIQFNLLIGLRVAIVFHFPPESWSVMIFRKQMFSCFVFYYYFFLFYETHICYWYQQISAEHPHGHLSPSVKKKMAFIRLSRKHVILMVHLLFGVGLWDIRAAVKYGRTVLLILLW